MSLINKMLQDLEQRGTGELSADGLPRQVRAVPEHEGMHTAWWLVLLLSIALVGMGAWLWLRAPQSLPFPARPAALPVPVVQPAQQPQQLPPAPAPTTATLTAPTAIEAPQPAPTAALAQTSAAAQNAVGPVAENSMPQLPAQTAAKPTPNVPTTPVAQMGAHAGDAGAAKQDRPANPVAATVETKPKAAAKPGKMEKTVMASAAIKRDAAAPGAKDESAGINGQIKELTPQQRAENAYHSAAIALQQGKQTDAMTDLQQALQLYPQHAAARQMLVGLLLQAKRNDEAVQLAQEGLSADPSQVGLAMILSRVQIEQGSLQAAIDTLNHSLQYATDRADYQAFLAALLQRDNRHKEAAEHYMAALAKAPQSGVWWMGLGISLQADNRLTDAREAFTRAKATNSLTPELSAFVDQKLRQLKQ